MRGRARECVPPFLAQVERRSSDAEGTIGYCNSGRYGRGWWSDRGLGEGAVSAGGLAAAGR